MHWWLPHWMGLDNGASPWYLFHSGIGANLGEYAIALGVLALVRKHNCHVHRCWRLARHPVGGTPFVTCRRHHPDGHLTAGAVAAAAREAGRE